MAFEDNGSGAGEWAQAAAPEDLMRSLLGRVVQETVEQEFERFIGAGRWERSGKRRGWRNGRKRRRLKTRVGSIELLIPKDREGRFQPSLFGRYERSEQALVLGLIEMYLQGVSTRRVSRIVEELCGFEISASQVSRLTRRLDEELGAWRVRDLSEAAYPYLVIDAHYEKVRREGKVRSTAVLWVVGVREDGYREHLGVWLGPTESETSWGGVFEDLVARGLRGVRFIVSDEHAGLRAALERYFPGAAQQRCQVHYLRNLLAQCPSIERFHEVRQALTDAWDADTKEGAEVRIRSLVEALEATSPRLSSWIEESVEETLAAFELPTPAERRKLRSTNGIEHEHAEIRRRTRVVRIFPNDDSLLRLASALASQRNDQWATRRYLLISREAQLQRAWNRIQHAVA
jgi:putative transposase